MNEFIPGEFKYDDFNRVTQFKNGDTVADYKYNPSGIRIEKKDGDDITRYHVSSGGLVLAESDKDGNAKAQIIWSHKSLMRKAQGKYYYYVYNEHGDVVQMVSEDATIVNEYEYDEWGNILKQKETVQNDIKYSGEYYDSESGLYYLRARYYDPTIGRFISRDSYEVSVTNPLSLNLYTYCHNNPINYSDPSGHIPTEEQLQIMDARNEAIEAEIQAFMDKGGKVVYTSSEVVLGGLTTVGTFEYMAKTCDKVTGTLMVIHGANSFCNGVTDSKYIYNGEWDKVGQTNYLKEHAYEPAIGTIVEGAAIMGGFDAEKGREYGEKAGATIYYMVDISLGARGTGEAITELKKPYWLRGEIITNNSLGYYYNLKGMNDDIRKERVDAVSGAAPVVK